VKRHKALKNLIYELGHSLPKSRIALLALAAITSLPFVQAVTGSVDLFLKSHFAMPSQ
jgi:hypothetical protein